jgi:branched-subunit amino acid aminotransferase/4-amino-4-deoxychorismate lyase
MAVIDGRILPLADARVGVLDLAFLRGCGVFETLRTYDGAPHALDRHLERLWAGGAEMGIAPLYDSATIRGWLARALAASGLGDSRITLVLSAGDLTDGVFGSAGARLVIILRAVQAPSDSAYREGQRVVLHEARRPLPEHKSTCYIVGHRALAKAKAANAHEAIYTWDGLAYEGVTSNLCALHGRSVWSPRSQVLPGITRDELRVLSAAEGLAWCDEPLPLSELRRAEEIWITSSVRELVPVVAVDGVPVGNGRPGPWAAILGPRLRAAMRAGALADAGRA